MQFHKLALLCAGVLAPGCALAGSQTITITEPTVTFATLQEDATRPTTFDFLVSPFDDALGRLIDVRLTVSNTSTVTETVSSINPQLVRYAGATARAGLTVTGPDGALDTATVTSGPFAGTIQAGTDSHGHVVLATVRNGGVQTTATNIVDITSPADLAGYGGSSPLRFLVTYDSVKSSGDTPGLFYGGKAITSGTFEVAYTYSVPEVSTWAMMGLGFAALGFAGYRAKAAAKSALAA